MKQQPSTNHDHPTWPEARLGTSHDTGLRIAVLIVGTVSWIPVLGLTAVVFSGWALSEEIQPFAVALGGMTIAWLFGVGLTWGMPGAAGLAFSIAAIVGLAMAVYSHTIAAEARIAIVVAIPALIALALAAMSMMAARHRRH